MTVGSVAGGVSVGSRAGKGGAPVARWIVAKCWVALTSDTTGAADPHCDTVICNALEVVLWPEPSDTVAATAYKPAKACGTNVGCASFADGENDSGAGTPFRCSVYV